MTRPDIERFEAKLDEILHERPADEAATAFAAYRLIRDHVTQILSYVNELETEGFPTLDVNDLMDAYQDGDEMGWGPCFKLMMQGDGERRTADLVENIRWNGIRVPVVIGPDNRVWSGHHRIFAASLLRLRVPYIKLEKS